MSMPFVEISCERCAFMGSSAVRWGRFAYRLDGYELPVWRTLGWCAACDDIRAVESPPAAEDIDRMRYHCRQLDRRLQTAEAEARERQNSLTRWLHLRPRSPLLHTLRKASHSGHESLETAERLQAIFSARRSGPRCLSCGSEDTTIFGEFFEPSNLDSHAEPREPELRTTRHPGCGGRFRVRYSDVRLNMRLDKTWFDSEGRRVQG